MAYLSSLEVAQWIINLFVKIGTADFQIQQELIELLTNEMLKVSFESGERHIKLYVCFV